MPKKKKRDRLVLVTTYIAPEQAQALKNIAAAAGKYKAEIIRDAIQHYIKTRAYDHLMPTE